MLTLAEFIGENKVLGAVSSRKGFFMISFKYICRLKRGVSSFSFGKNCIYGIYFL